jgi:sigma-E factor negative regulatory protein RseA
MVGKMTTESREHLSCLMDGEISRETGRFLVRRLGADEELCATWARYHLVRDCLRHGGGRFAGEGLSSRVRRAIEHESLPAAPRRKLPHWLKPAAGLAVAASVALMAIVAVGPGGQPSQQPATGLVDSAPTDAFTSPQTLGPAPISRQVSLAGGPAGDSRMNAYLLRHYQATGSTGGRGFVTFVPIVIDSSARVGNAGQDDRTERNADQAEDRAAERAAEQEEDATP